jgi:hypothetical protein
MVPPPQHKETQQSMQLATLRIKYESGKLTAMKD